MRSACGLYDLAGRLGATQALRDLGMPESGIEEAVRRTMADPYWNPRPLEAEALRELLAKAWHGERPSLAG